MAKIKKNTRKVMTFFFNTVAFSLVVSVASALPSFLKNYTTLIPGSNIAHADTPHYSGGGDGDTGGGSGDTGGDTGGGSGGGTDGGSGGPGSGACDDGPDDGNGGSL